MAEIRTGAERLARALSEAGVRTIFSLSGNQIMPVYDACIDAAIRIVHVRHEAAAVHMADAHAQVTGAPAVALVTAAPGFLNALSPLYSARLAESPVVLLSGDAPVSADGRGAFQELDQGAVVSPLVKLTLRPRRAEDLGPSLAEAMRAAVSGRPGPVHVALPFDVLQAGAPIADAAAPAQEAGPAADRRALDPVLGALAAARRPVVLVGPRLNASRAGAALGRVRAATGVPVVPMESPRGLRDPALGAVADVVRRADLIVLLGKVADFSVGFLGGGALAEDVCLAVVDPEPAAIERARRLAGSRPFVAAEANPAEALGLLAEARGLAAESGWAAEVDAAVARRASVEPTGGLPHPGEVCRAVAAWLAEAEDPILVCDGGEFGQWAQAECAAPTRIINGLSGAIGGGIGHAIGAKIARPGARVVALMGDGTVGFHLAEFETAAREGANVVILVGNDSRWNAEHQIQLRSYGPDRLIGCDLSPQVRYDLAAAALGAHGEFVERADQLPAALARAGAAGRPALVNVIIEGIPAPVVAAGATEAH